MLKANRITFKFHCIYNSNKSTIVRTQWKLYFVYIYVTNEKWVETGICTHVHSRCDSVTHVTCCICIWLGSFLFIAAAATIHSLAYFVCLLNGFCLMVFYTYIHTHTICITHTPRYWGEKLERSTTVQHKITKCKAVEFIPSDE